MRNILKETPKIKLGPRLKFSIDFVKDQDIKNKKILDIGCGFGWFEENALQKGVTKIIGIEISKEDLRAANIIKDKRAFFKVAGALKLPFSENSFDTVVAWEVIEHIPKFTENIMFKEANRVLKKGGIFYLSTPYNSFLAKLSDPAWWLIGHRHYSKEKLKQLGLVNGFKINKIYIKGKWWTLINIVNLYISKWIFRRKPFFENEILKKENEEYKLQDGFMGIFIKYEKE